MILLPQGRTILLIATSLFIATFSMVLFLFGGVQESADPASLKTSVLEDFFSHEESVNKNERQAATLPSITVDPSGIIISAGETFLATYEYEHADVAGKVFFSLINPSDLTAIAKDFSAAGSSGKITVNAGPYHLLTASGAEHVVLITFSPEKNTSGKRVVVLTIKDISESIEKNDENDGVKGIKGKAIKETDDKNNKNRIIVEKTS